MSGSKNSKCGGHEVGASLEYLRTGFKARMTRVSQRSGEVYKTHDGEMEQEHVMTRSLVLF